MAEKRSARPNINKKSEQKPKILSTRRVVVNITRDIRSFKFPGFDEAIISPENFYNSAIVFKIITPNDVIIYHRIKVMSMGLYVKDSVTMLPTNDGYRYSVNYKGTSITPFALQGVYLTGKMVGPGFVENIDPKSVEISKMQDFFSEYYSILSIRNGQNKVYMLHPEGWSLRVAAISASVTQTALQPYISVNLSLVPLRKYLPRTAIRS